MIVTEIKKIGRGDRYSLYLNGSYVCALEAETLAKRKLKTGDELSAEELEQLRLESGDLASFDRALTYLEKGMKTEKGIRDYLLSKSYLEESVDNAVEKLKEYGYINDEAYAESYIKTYSSSKGAKRIKYDLISKGVDKSLIDEKLDQLLLEEDELETCEKICKKYLKGKVFDQKTKQKLFAHLTGKGFGVDIILKVIRQIDLEMEDESRD